MGSGKETLEQGDDGRGSKRGRVLSSMFFLLIFLLAFGYCVCHHHRHTRPPTAWETQGASGFFIFYFQIFFLYYHFHLFTIRLRVHGVRQRRRMATTTPHTTLSYESKFILDLFIFWVFPARFLRWFAANVDFSTRSRVCTCDMFGINQGRFYKPLAFNVDFFPRSHDFSVMKFHYSWTRRKKIIQIPYLPSSMFGINQVRFLELLLLSLTFSHGHVISQSIYCVVLCGMTHQENLKMLIFYLICLNPLKSWLKLSKIREKKECDWTYSS